MKHFYRLSHFLELTLLSIFFSIVVWIPAVFSDEVPNPEQKTLASFHLLDETCSGQCHKGENVSDDLTYEYQSCIECHDTLANLEGSQHNIKHQESEQMECVECHIPHEEFNPKDICTDCHDEDYDELSKLNSARINRFIQGSIYSRSSNQSYYAYGLLTNGVWVADVGELSVVTIP